MATAAAGGGDPRLSNAGLGMPNNYMAPHMRKLHDKNVSFEEYQYYAALTRAEEDSQPSNTAERGIRSTIFPSKSSQHPDITSRSSVPPSYDEKNHDEKNLSAADGNLSDSRESGHVSDDEWAQASRAVRLATWSAVFYLITTDVLGPYGVPFAIGTLGWGPGIALYTVFGVLAGYGGWLLWKMFLGLDSYQYPLRSYGDLAYRLNGTLMRHFINILQSIQLLCNVGVIVVSNGQALSQVSKFRLCYAICCLIWAVAGFVLGQVRTLQKFGWIANFAVWLNLLIIFITMGVAAHSLPNYAAAQGASAGAANFGPAGPTVAPDPTTGAYPAVYTTAGLPNPNSFIGSVNGLMQGVYAYGGAMLFLEFMAEMKRPKDFIKGMACAQVFIYVAYMLYGLFMYAYQGQYAVNPSYQGISPYAWQSVGNILAIISALIAAALYGNIGVKVLYNNVFVDFFNAPPLTSKRGKLYWALIIPVYWSIAFIIAAAIPNFFGLTAIVAAVCILQFTYTFPPMFYVAYCIKKGAALPGEGFHPSTGLVRHDGGITRLIRGFMAGAWWLNVWNVLYVLGALVTAGLGSYSAIEGLIAAFSVPGINAFTCTSPLAG